MNVPSIQEIKDKAKRFLNKKVKAGGLADRYFQKAQGSFNQVVAPANRYLGSINTRPISSRMDSTAGKLVGGIVETPYTFLTALPKFYGQTMEDTRSGQLFSNQGAQRTAGRAVNTALDTMSGGLLNKGKTLIKAAGPALRSRTPGLLTDLVKQGAKTGLKTGTGYGAGYGFGSSMEQNKSPLEIAKETARQAAFGGITGVALGGGIPALSGIFKGAKHDLQVKMGKDFGRGDMIPERGQTVNSVSLPKQGFDPNAPQLPRALAEVNAAIPKKAGMGIEDVSRGQKPIMPEPKVDDFPIMSGRTPLLLNAGRQKTSSIKEARGMMERNKIAPEYKGELKPGVEPIVPRPNVAGMKMTTADDIERALLGNSSMDAPVGGKDGVGVIGDNLRKVENRADTIASSMIGSENVVLRTIGNTLRGFMGTLGKSEEVMRQSARMHGTSDFGSKLAEGIRKAVPNDQASLERIHSNLDPELYGGKVAALTPQEKESASLLRLVSDYINDTNYKNGFINEEQWLKNRDGKYIARAYESYDMPPEIADFMKSSRAKFDLNPFKKRGELDDWKIDNAIKDPVYLMQKRLQQTVFNDSTKKMFSWLSGTEYTSQTERAGFTKLSDHKAYGDLAGKWVRKDIMEDVQGLYFEHKALQGAYDALKWFDMNPLRRGLKKAMTVFNPVVRVGNNVGNNVFAWLGGINPVTFTKNQIKASNYLKTNHPLALKLQKDGILGTGTHRGDIMQYASELKAGVNDPNILKQIDDIASKSYAFVDDRAKLAAVMTYMERGASYGEAVKRASRSFQNYHTVGFLYDIGSKVPILGNPFVRFQASLGSILKSAAVDRPIRLVGTALALKYLGDAASVASGETPEDRKIREARVGAPHIPFTDISLEFQTPWGAVNAARMLGVYAANPVDGQSFGSDLSKMAPLKDPRDPRSYGGDPLVGPLISAGLTDKDFRGKSISDPDQTKFQPSTLTPMEKAGNVANYLRRAYTPSFINAVEDAGSAVMGKEDFYGRTRTPLQGISSALGVKVEQFGPEQAQDRRVKDMQFDQYKREDTKRGVNSVLKELQAGTIDQATADKRIKNLTSGLSEGMQSSGASGNGRIVKNPMGGFSYTDKNGDFKTVDTMEKAEKNIAKMDFEDSDKNFMEWKGRVFRKGEDGSVIEQSKAKFYSSLYSAQLTDAKNNEDYKQWFSVAKEQYQNLSGQLEDPNIDPLDAQSIKNQIATLVKQAAKFQRYGGFTKPKAPRKAKAVKFKATTTKKSAYKPVSLNLKPIKFPSTQSGEATFKVGPGFKVK